MPTPQEDATLKELFAEHASEFSTTGFAKRVEKPWGWELLWTPQNLPYAGKILHITQGARLSLQAHDEKQESWLLLNGQAKVLWDDNLGNLVETELRTDEGFSCHIGQRHRLVGVSDCDVLEVSTPELGTTYRIEDDYARQDETEEVRNSPNRGWKS